MSHVVTFGPLSAHIRECWLDASNLRLSGERPEWTARPTIHALVIEAVRVDETERRQGHLKRILAMLCADSRFDMIVVEAVQNPILAEALLRWDWGCDPGVMDFYKRTERRP
jgi:hypothetical protein